MSMFCSAYNTVRSTLAPYASRVAQSRAVVTASRMARSEAGAMRSFYDGASGSRMMRSMGAVTGYAGSSNARMGATLGVASATGVGLGLSMRSRRRSYR